MKTFGNSSDALDADEIELETQRSLFVLSKKRPDVASIGYSCKTYLECCLAQVWVNLQTPSVPNKLLIASWASSAVSGKASTCEVPFIKAPRQYACNGIMPYTSILFNGLLSPSFISKPIFWEKSRQTSERTAVSEMWESFVIAIWNTSKFKMCCAVEVLKFNDFKGQETPNSLTKTLFAMSGSELLSEHSEWNALLWYKMGSICWQRLMKIRAFPGNSLILSKLNFLIQQVPWKFLASSGRKGVTTVCVSLVCWTPLYAPWLMSPFLLASRCYVGYEFAKSTSVQKGSYNMYLELLPMLLNRSWK